MTQVTFCHYSFFINLQKIVWKLHRFHLWFRTAGTFAIYLQRRWSEGLVSIWLMAFGFQMWILLLMIWSHTRWSLKVLTNLSLSIILWKFLIISKIWGMSVKLKNGHYFYKLSNYGRPVDLRYSAFVSRACALCPWTCWICLYPKPRIAPSCGLPTTSARADLTLWSGPWPRQPALAWKPGLSGLVPATRQICVPHTSSKNAQSAEFSDNLFRWKQV